MPRVFVSGTPLFFLIWLSSLFRFFLSRTLFTFSDLRDLAERIVAKWKKQIANPDPVEKAKEEKPKKAVKEQDENEENEEVSYCCQAFRLYSQVPSGSSSWKWLREA